MELTFTESEKLQISEKIIEGFKRSGFASQARYARSIGLDKADISNLKGKKWQTSPQLIGAQKWVRMARASGFVKNEEQKWTTAETKVKRFVDRQLTICKQLGFTSILVDEAGIGKTYACREFATHTPSVFYLDCSNYRTRTRFIEAIARVVGIQPSGRYDDILADSIYSLSMIDSPLVILDEAGDLEDKAMMEFRRMYNSLEGRCGFYLVGSDGLKARIERGLRLKKAGYKEVFSRFGKNFSRIMPLQLQDQVQEYREMGEEILKINGITEKGEIAEILTKLNNNGVKDLRTINREVRKYRYMKGGSNE